MKVELTKSQCRTLVEFIEMNIFKTIRDIEIDNIDWLKSLIQAHHELVCTCRQTEEEHDI